MKLISRTKIEDEEKDPGERGSKVLVFEDLKLLLQDANFRFPGASIQDRSKGDTLEKLRVWRKMLHKHTFEAYT